MMSLTPRQQECFRLIEAGMAKTGIAPSYAELATGLGLSAKSKGTVMVLVCALEERGYIRRLPGKNRALEVVDGASGRSIKLNPEIHDAVSGYALEIGKSVDTAVNELLRQAMGLA